MLRRSDSFWQTVQRHVDAEEMDREMVVLGDSTARSLDNGPPLLQQPALQRTQSSSDSPGSHVFPPRRRFDSLDQLLGLDLDSSHIGQHQQHRAVIGEREDDSFGDFEMQRRPSVRFHVHQRNNALGHRSESSYVPSPGQHSGVSPHPVAGPAPLIQRRPSMRFRESSDRQLDVPAVASPLSSFRAVGGAAVGEGRGDHPTITAGGAAFSDDAFGRQEESYIFSPSGDSRNVGGVGAAAAPADGGGGGGGHRGESRSRSVHDRDSDYSTASVSEGHSTINLLTPPQQQSTATSSAAHGRCFSLASKSSWTFVLLIVSALSVIVAAVAALVGSSFTAVERNEIGAWVSSTTGSLHRNERGEVVINGEGLYFTGFWQKPLKVATALELLYFGVGFLPTGSHGLRHPTIEVVLSSGMTVSITAAVGYHHTRDGFSEVLQMVPLKDDAGAFLQNLIVTTTQTVARDVISMFSMEQLTVDRERITLHLRTMLVSRLHNVARANVTLVLVGIAKLPHYFRAAKESVVILEQRISTNAANFQAAAVRLDTRRYVAMIDKEAELIANNATAWGKQTVRVAEGRQHATLAQVRGDSLRAIANRLGILPIGSDDRSWQRFLQANAVFDRSSRHEASTTSHLMLVHNVYTSLTLLPPK